MTTEIRGAPDPMRALLVDDEAPARARLRRLLEKRSAPLVTVVGEAKHGLDALEKIDELGPDIVFLDIEMPELGGFGVAEALAGRADAPAIVFVTAYDQHALRAFEASAVDYLVKPVIEERLGAALDKADRYRKPAPARSAVLAPREPLPAESGGRFAIRCGSKYVVFDPAKVSAILARDHYAGVVVDGRELLADDSLDVLARRLKTETFVRVHRSAVINLDFLHELEREGDRKYTAVLRDTNRTRVSVARERLPDLKARLGLA